MLKNLKITTKILLLVLFITLGTLLTISVVSYTQLLDTSTFLSSVNANLGLTSSSRSKQALLGQSEQYMKRIGQLQAESTNKDLMSIRVKINEMSEYLTALYANDGNFEGRELPLPDKTEMGVASSKYMLAPGVEMTEALHDELLLVSNAEYAFAPVLENDPMLDNVYLGTESGISYRYSRSNSYNPDYDPRARGWYTAAKAAPDGAVWLDTYLDSYGSVCITCAQAFFDREGDFVGVVAMDITLQKMVEEILDIKIGSTGYTFILDRNLQFIAHPLYGDSGEKTGLEELFSGNVASLLSTVANSDAGFIHNVLDGVESYMAFATLQETGWKICITTEVGEIIEPADRTKADIDEDTRVAQDTIQNTLSSAISRYVLLFAAIGLAVIVLAFAISGSISRPILRLVSFTREVGGGNLEAKAPVLTNDEVGELARSFNAMTDDLQEHIRQLTSVTADKERIETELNVATQIQKSMLPSIFPAFEDRSEFRVYATMDPAKEVGGDFYDFFMVDDRHLAIVMADVSGKGVPAALFMVIGKTLIKDHTVPGVCLTDVFHEVNNTLCESNSEGLFITAFEGVLDLVTGEFTYVNAGHEHPFIYRPGEGFTEQKIRAGFVLAGMEDMNFRGGSFQLRPGDKLFQYTDGVTEATDGENRLYGMERLTAVLNSHGEEDAYHILPAVKDDIDAFVGEAPQFDDITMLCLEYLRPMEETE